MRETHYNAVLTAVEVLSGMCKSVYVPVLIKKTVLTTVEVL